MKWKQVCKLALMTMTIAGTAMVAAAQSAEPEIVLMNTVSGRVVSTEEMVRDLSDYDVVFFGEFHDKDAIHRMEEQVLEGLYRQHKDTLVLSMEMFERDVQPKMDSYLAGTITEKDFLADSRPWPRYQTDYRGLVEFAKEKHLPVIASNIPRYMAASYAKTGTLANFTEEEKQYLPQVHYAPEGAYKEKFAKAMSGMAGAEGMHVMPERIPAMYQAQCLKDDTMAESIAQYMDAHKEAKVFHVQGEFHGGERLGVVQKLAALRPELKLAVISSVRDDGRSPEELVKAYKDNGDFILIDKTK